MPVHTVPSDRRGSGAQRWLATAGLSAFCVLGGIAALAVPASAAYQAEPAAQRYQTVGSAPTAAGYTGSATNSAAVYRGSARTTAAVASRAAAVGPRVTAEARKHRGQPYRYGAAGPNRFDCSGFTLYVYRKFGIRLPHKASQQRSRGRAIARGQQHVGDLVVFRQGGSWGHVAIYLGDGYIIHAPHPGAAVRVQRLWTNAIVFRRLIG
jgi:cell wall-associated NlpC family hydrolase